MFGFGKKNKCESCPIKKIVEEGTLAETKMSGYLQMRLDGLLEGVHKLEVEYLGLLEENRQLKKENKQLKGKEVVQFT